MILLNLLRSTAGALKIDYEIMADFFDPLVKNHFFFFIKNSLRCNLYRACLHYELDEVVEKMKRSTTKAMYSMKGFFLF
jgi:hypothetical protein